MTGGFGQIARKGFEGKRVRGALTAVFIGFLAQPALADPLPAPVTDADFPSFPMEQILLGRDLFFDPVLSGNRNIACATCHHPTLGTSDGMSLSIGEGGLGLGAQRKATEDNRPHARIPRNAPALFNIGAREFTVMFHDGRVELSNDAIFGIRMPEGRTLEKPMPSALAAQAMLPILSADEMSGQAGENDVATAVDAGRIHGSDGAWAILAARIAAIPAYRDRFAAQGVQEPHITDIAQALAAFITNEFRAINSPFDRHLRDGTPLAPAQKAGMDLFYGKARCSTCHSGPFQTDHGFHAIGMPQFGPGKNTDSAYAQYADLGRGMVTGVAADYYRFRTPSLRNVALTAPYGHNGAYARLEDILHHHMDALAGLTGYDRSAALLPGGAQQQDFVALDDTEEMIRIAAAIEIQDVALTEGEIAELLSFLDALTDERAALGALGAPDAVPSGLPMDSQ
ncbi:cytochrome-c peroxidase [Sulfitobacter sp. EhC04]|uniref:cytochrome-c peroxidase n=1 Tax=Sulfitobacter sp. EhC04 TaxID=1849168 RepID=UPI0009EE96E9|nr:cytochrome c peroxidase [Sulfitobacter sp. EhC04]